MDDRICGGLWQTPGVEEQPALTVTKWRVLEITQGKLAGQRHIVGYCCENHEGRASTAIVSYNKNTRIATTKSGRKYKLQGSTGFSYDADYVWRVWSQDIPVRDVSTEYDDTPATSK